MLKAVAASKINLDGKGSSYKIMENGKYFSTKYFKREVEI